LRKSDRVRFDFASGVEMAMDAETKSNRLDGSLTKRKLYAYNTLARDRCKPRSTAGCCTAKAEEIPGCPPNVPPMPGLLYRARSEVANCPLDSTYLGLKCTGNHFGWLSIARRIASTRAAVAKDVGAPHSRRARHAAWSGERGTNSSFHTSENRGRPADGEGADRRCSTSCTRASDPDDSSDVKHR